MQSRFEHDFFLVRRNAFGQTNWSQPFVKPVHADDVEVDAEPAAVCNLPMRFVDLPMLFGHYGENERAT